MAKLSTAEILAKARAEAAGKSGESQPKEESTPAAEDVYEETAASEAESAEDESAEAEPAAAAAKPTPKSTADILAAARAQAGGKSGGESAPAKPKSPASASKPAASGGAPKSTSDILASARAQAGGGDKPAAKEKPAAAKPAAKGKPAAPAKPAGDRPSVQEMLKAVREGKPVESAAAKPGDKPAAPPVPTRPAPAKKGAKPAAETRRNALVALVATPFALAWTLFTAASGVFTLAMARFMMPNVLIEPPTQFKIGPPGDYPPGTVSAKWKAQFAIWIVNTVYKGKPMIYALSTVCTHLGCTPNWLEGEQKFKCPCHGSGFYINGVNFEGPAPRPLERVGISLAADGMLQVDKSLKFQEEMGQWEDANSFVVPPVA